MDGFCLAWRLELAYHFRDVQSLEQGAHIFRSQILSVLDPCLLLASGDFVFGWQLDLNFDLESLSVLVLELLDGTDALDAALDHDGKLG